MVVAVFCDGGLYSVVGCILWWVYSVMAVFYDGLYSVMGCILCQAVFYDGLKQELLEQELMQQKL